MKMKAAEKSISKRCVIYLKHVLWQFIVSSLSLIADV